jgi:ribosomal protein L37E
VKNLGVDGWCSAHLAEPFSAFDPAVFKLNGIGLQTGALVPEFGPLYAHLTCRACGADWVGVPGETCTWCQRARERLLEWQAECVLEPPAVDPQDVLYEQRMRAWAERLAAAVKGGVITETEARRAWTRTVDCADAA